MSARGLAPFLGTLLVLAGCGRTSLSLYEDGGPEQEGGVTEAGIDAGDGGRVDAGDGGPEGGVEAGVDGGDGGCQRACNDGVGCTDDECDPTTGACVFVPNSLRCPMGQVCVQNVGCRAVPCSADEFCADGFFCNGAERCDNGVCVRGRPVECASSSCQTNRCDESTRNCVGTWRDDDGDGFGPIQCMGGDCDDNNRRVFPGAPENCSDSRDNDCNGRVDCDDGRCANAVVCQPPPPTETNCRNGVDDDFDGRTDCADNDCVNRPVCQMQNEICDDGRDNDGDNAVDCSDSDCFNHPDCVTNLCDDLRNPRDAARQACTQRFGSNCVDTGSASIIGFAPPSSQGSNCDIGEDRWLQFCYADAQDTFNCNRCEIGAIKLAHEPCTCGDNTETIGDFCEPQQPTCPSLDLGSRVGRVAAGVTTGNANDFAPSCVPGGHTAPEVTHRWRAPSAGSWTFDTIGSDFDAALSLLRGSCSGAEIACDDDGGSGFQASATVSLTAGQVVIIVVDGYGSANGSYALNIGRTVTTEVGLCNDGLDNDTDSWMDCQDSDCWMDPFCLTPLEQGHCGDGQDNDFDGLIDCQDFDCFFDPLCMMRTEQGACDDTLDNDGDGRIDCADADCFNDEACVTDLCRDLPARDAARAACAARFGSNCVDTGSASFIGFASPSTQGSNCDVGINRWAQFCYADAYDTYNCNNCQVGAIKLAHNPCECGDNTETVGDFCEPQRTERGACGDFVDNDGDGAIDCADSECTSDPLCVMVPECPMFDLGSRTGSFIARGSTAGQLNNLSPFCIVSSAPEVTFRWRAPQAGTWQIDTGGSTYDTALYVIAGGCQGDQIACNDDGLGRQSLVTVTLSRGQEVVIVVDGWSTSVGNYALNITSLITDEIGRCDDDVDNDEDGVADCADPDCFMEPVCLAPTCPDAELGSAVGMPVIADSTVGQGNDFTPTCLGISSDAPDVAYHWRAPVAGRWVFDTIGSGYDTVLSVLRGDCDGQTLACDDDSGGSSGSGRDSLVTVNLTRGQDVVIVVDGFSRSSGNYVLNIGRIVNNERGQCADFVDNDVDGAPDCEDFDCADDPACLQMCEGAESGISACTDGRDNDCDSLPDCADPDCNALFGGECCNGVDDNGDGLVDLLACGCQTDNDCEPMDSPIGIIPGVCWPSLGACGPDCSSFGVQVGNAICRFINPALSCQRSTGQCVISPQP